MVETDSGGAGSRFEICVWAAVGGCLAPVITIFNGSMWLPDLLVGLCATLILSMPLLVALGVNLEGATVRLFGHQRAATVQRKAAIGTVMALVLVIALLVAVRVITGRA